MGHALTVKHFGREVPKGGVMLYFGMPAAFVETTDIWLEPKRARLAVTWNGPYTGLIIGGLAAIFIYLYPSASINSFLFKMLGVA
jgi:putative peptide zinc metalloprotease protein